MRVAVASCEYEGNSLSLRVDRKEDFERKGLVRGQQVLAFANGKQTALAGGIEALQDEHCVVVPILAAKGGAGGHVEEAFFQDILAEIINGIAAQLPLDGVYLALHGAMICDQEKDPEGAILQGIRSAVGPGVPISASLDLHAHVSDRMVENADILVGYETYPHVDAYETGKKAAGLLIGAMKGEFAPVMRIKKYNAIFPVLGGATLGDAPMAKVAAKARQIEDQNRAFSVSYFPVQPWLDMADVGITGLAVTDGDAEAADAVAQEILDEMWLRRRAFELDAMTPEEAVKAALASDAKTTLLIDAPDSIGGGAAGDSPALLAAIVAHAPDTAAALCIYDPYTAQLAFELGRGAEAEFEIGAWLDTRWADPVKIKATVESLHDGTFIYTGGPAASLETTLGPSVVLRVGGLQLLCASHAVYENADEHYSACGIDISQCRLVSFKNLMNFRKLLSDTVNFIALHGLGATPLRLQDVDWQNRKRPFWPADDMATPSFI
ncbi:M81 family metallopeptidase [Octadecabacter sp. G9-8]|uniref:M81 family metallopeptidase n=1 Tax=Octadecabacter dasysiphoniae TaxID=2909341 RepID=A0ABS9CT62_9RHOB|nr:M81 family metallopeptidase [Octadecabacter dasysiphoniae]MCF2870411.1 M81 family metallopeptidase [Octadecabacter dasysiphoniae]